ncbi:MAG: hypothetical protein ACK5TR_03240 [Alphaproteobacteria bacterium]|jgi:hypothetical protein|nr:hypothetical protein [Alphaproteobacteria bacterium]
MKSTSLASVLTPKNQDFRVFCMYGNRQEVITWRRYLLRAYMRLVHPDLSHVYVNEIPTPAPSLWGGEKEHLYFLDKTISPKEMPALIALKGVSVFEHKSLTAKSPLLKEYESHPQVMFVSCYDAPFLEVEKWLSLLKTLKDISFESTSVARLRLLWHQGPEFLPDVFDKLLLLETKTVLDEDLLALMPPASFQKSHQLLEAFLAPDRASFIKTLAGGTYKEEDTFMLVRQVLGIIKPLHQAFTRTLEGESPLQAVKAQRYPLFFGKEGDLARILTKHHAQSFSALLGLVWDMEKDQKSQTLAPVAERKWVQLYALFHAGKDGRKETGRYTKMYA